MARTKEKSTKLRANRSKAVASKRRPASTSRSAKAKKPASATGKAGKKRAAKATVGTSERVKRKKVVSASASKKTAPKAARKAAAVNKAPKRKKPATVKKAPKAASKKAKTPVAAPEIRQAPPPRPARITRRARPIPPPPPPAVDRDAERLAKAARQVEQRQTEHYEKAVAYFNERKFGRALSLLEKAADGPNATLRHRAQVYADICRQQVGNEKIHLKTAEDHYNYAVKLINDRRLEDAEQHLQRALKLSPKAGYVHYANAVLSALRGDASAAFGNLKRAIEIDPQNRVMALNDADLAGVVGHPSIAQLLHQGGEG